MLLRLQDHLKCGCLLGTPNKYFNIYSISIWFVIKVHVYETTVKIKQVRTKSYKQTSSKPLCSKVTISRN